MQVKLKVALAVSDTAVVPLVGSVVFQPVAPLEVQLVAFWLVQVNCVGCPAVTVVGLADSVAVGSAEAIWIEYKP